MISIRTLTPVCLIAAGALASAQQPAAAPQPPGYPQPRFGVQLAGGLQAAAAPQAPATPQAPTAPQAPAAPSSPGMHRLLGPADAFDFSGLSDQITEQVKEKLKNIDKLDLKGLTDQLKDLKFDYKFDFDSIDADQIREQAREQAEMAREQAEMVREQARAQADMAREQVKIWAMDQDWAGFAKGFAFAPFQVAPAPPVPPKVITAPYVNLRGRSVDSLYERGLSSLDNHRYDQALDLFSEVATRGGSHADGALYWKAYTLNKLGRRDEANAALAELHKSFASSRWLDDAKALEIEVRQSSGQKVSPEAESNDDLKLLALEGLVQSDPDRAFPILDQLLKKAQSPNFKKKAIYVLALNNSPRAQQLLEQIARGSGNPDMQMTAIQYLGTNSKDANKGQVLFEIYNASNDANVKRAALRGIASNRDKDHLLQIAKSDKSVELRQEAIRMLGNTATAQEMWTLYQAETDLDVKRAILDYVSGSTDRLTEIARTEKDAKLRRSAIQRLGSPKSAASSDALVAIYGTETDASVKRTIIDVFAGQRNAPALVAVARKENDVELKRYIVRRMLDLKSSPEINQFLEEILK
jgi:hypothetical protein